jgi:hypothetical protein
MGVREFNGLMPSDLFGAEHILSLKGLFSWFWAACSLALVRRYTWRVYQRTRHQRTGKSAVAFSGSDDLFYGWRFHRDMDTAPLSSLNSFDMSGVKRN